MMPYGCCKHRVLIISRVRDLKQRDINTSKGCYGAGARFGVWVVSLLEGSLDDTLSNPARGVYSSIGIGNNYSIIYNNNKLFLQLIPAGSR